VNLSGPVSRANSRSTGILPLLCLLFSALAQARAPLVLLTDFGIQDGAVSAMKGRRPGSGVNSLLNLAVALNQQSYAALHKIESGPD
jgi:hypothetical protein